MSPRASRAKPGQPVSADVLLEGAHDLRMYQVAVEVHGGVSGELVLEDVFIDTDREDYVFAGHSAVSIPDPRRQRAVSALWQGGTNAVGNPRLPSHVYVCAVTRCQRRFQTEAAW